MDLGTKNRKQTIAAAALGVVLVLIVLYEFWPSSSTIASTTSASAEQDPAPARPSSHKGSNTAAKKVRPQQNLDPTLHLDQLAAAEQIKYEGSGRNIFVAQAEVQIPLPQANGTTDVTKVAARQPWVPPQQPPPAPIPLKFFGFASQPGEPKKIFLSKGEDVFIAGEGEIIDRRYKVVKISTNSVEIQDVVVSGSPQTIPLTQTNPS